GTIRMFSATEREQLKGQRALFTLPATTPTTEKPATSSPIAPPAIAHVSEPQAHYASGDLDATQQQAVQAEGGPIVVIAGPGAGKTRTLTQRIVHLMHQHGVPGDQILAVTFTRRAAAEMHARLRQLLPDSAVDGLRIGTFHRLALDLMRLYAATPLKTVLDAWEARQLLHIALHAAGLPLRSPTLPS